MCLKISIFQRLCKANRSTLKCQPIYLNSRILVEMLHALYYLFNNNLELDSYIAIEAISEMAEDEILVDVMLMCNSIKNLIQQNKSEPSIQNALSNTNNNNNNPAIKTNRSGSISSNKKKTTNEATSIVTTNSFSSNPLLGHISNLKKGESVLDSNSSNSDSSSPHPYEINFIKSDALNNQTVDDDARTEIPKQQSSEFMTKIENLPSPIPTSLPPQMISSESEVNFAKLNHGM